jgi:hypothetical protein
MEIGALLVHTVLDLPQGLDTAHVPSVAEEDKPDHPGDQEIVDQDENYDARQVFGGARLGFAQSAVFLTYDVFPGVRIEELDRPAAVRDEETDVHVENSKGGVLVGYAPVDDKSNYRE